MLGKFLKPEFDELIQARDWNSLREAFTEMDPADVAEVIEDLPAKDSAVLFRLLPRDMAAVTFEYLPPHQQTELVTTLGNEELKNLLNEMAPDERSPYSALSGMAIDPIYLSLDGVPDFQLAGGVDALDGASRATLNDLRRSTRVDYAGVRAVKRTALRLAFDLFCERDWRAGSSRAAALRAFADREAWWLADYALFRALHDREGHRPWTTWPEPIQRRDPAALDDARRELAREVLFHEYLQWAGDEQWRHAREAAPRYFMYWRPSDPSM